VGAVLDRLPRDWNRPFPTLEVVSRWRGGAAQPAPWSQMVRAIDRAGLRIAAIRTMNAHLMQIDGMRREFRCKWWPSD
jgi:hypothetical protein